MHRAAHIWIDAVTGNDALAMQFNVTALNTARCIGTEITPLDVVDTSQRPLLHQPYPFKTITAAVAYINSLPPTVSSTDPLPYLSPITGFQWDYAVLHLLPGRYASVNAPDWSQSLHNQLPANLETFPIQLPNRVSIQGTSALDTVIELGRGEGPAFLFGHTAQTRGAGTFISSISIMGATPWLQYAPPAPPWPRQYTCAAIALSKNVECELRIDDCFLFANGIALLADGEHGVHSGHKITITNCSFVWNSIGIWSGDVAVPVGGVTKGAALILLLNNLFDTSPPLFLELTAPTCGTPRPFPARWREVCIDMATTGVYGPGTMSAFEGVDASDLLVATSQGMRNFNAYEAAASPRFDKRVSWPFMQLAAAHPRGSAPGGPAVGFDIAPFTGAQQVPALRRGVLFVADLFRNGMPLGTGNPAQRFATGVSCDFDLSPMDFRLSPAVTLANLYRDPMNVPGDLANGGALNPLVDRGYGEFPLSGANGMTLQTHPRALSLTNGNNTWPFASWADFDDAEGHGNRRVFDHPAYPNHGPSTVPIDIGADELDFVIVAGFRYGTRTFTQRMETPYRVDNRYVWVLGPPATLAPQPPQQVVQLLSYSANWWASPGPAAYNNLGWGPWDPLFPLGYYNPLVAFVTPHLLPDVHPYHAVTLSGQWPSNPVWQDCLPLQPLHNVFLYIDPTEPLPNPPGVYPAVPVPQFSFLDGIASPWSGHQIASGGQQRVPFGLQSNGGNLDLGGTAGILVFGGWCQAYSSSPTAWPGTPYREAHILGDAVGTPPYDTWNNVYPHKDPKDTAPPDPMYRFLQNGVQRITAEFVQGGTGTFFGYPGSSNVQTFMIWRQSPAQ